MTNAILWGEMFTQIETILVVVAALLIASVIASKASGRLGVPALLLFLLVGMLAGSEGPGGIPFDDPWIAQSIGVVALALILFSGGLDTDWGDVRPALWKGLSLSTLGVLLTAVLVGGFAMLVLDVTWLEGLLLGTVVSSTDAAAVFSVLRSKGINLRGQIAQTLELESGSNDPMAVFLTIALTGLLVNPDASIFGLLPMFVLQMVLGAVVGYGSGKSMIWIVNRSHLEYEGLYPALTLALMLFTYGATAALGGNGFLAVYLAGLVMGNSDFVHKRSLMRFHDGLAWLMQIAMFLALGLLVFPSRLVPVAGAGVLIALFLMLVARPISVFISLLWADMDLREKSMVAWVGLRGAVPIVLATFPMLAGLPRAQLLFDLVFFIVLTSVLLQGTSLPWVAHWLGVEAPTPSQYHYPLEYVPDISMNSHLVEVPIPSSSPILGRSIVEIGLPKGALIVLIHREGDSIVPNGGTVLQPEDRLLVLADGESIAQVETIVQECQQVAHAKEEVSG
jgi:cell volume regulation protein A